MDTVLIICTSHNQLGGTGYPTGVWLSEVTHPYESFRKAGLKVLFGSPKGGQVPIDPYSDPRTPVCIAAAKDDGVSRKFLDDAEAMAGFNNSLPLSKIDQSSIGAVFVAGGNGAIFDLPESEDSIRFLESWVAKNKPLGTVCHGTASLRRVRLPDGSLFATGKTLTGFSNLEESIAGAQIGVEYLPFYLETELRASGALFKAGPPFQPFAVRGGTPYPFVSGQQNFSGSQAAELLILEIVRARRNLEILPLAQENSEKELAAKLIGVWQSEQLERVPKLDGRLLFRSRKFRIHAERYELLIDVYGDANGSQRVFSLFFEGPWSITGKSQIAGALESSWTHHRIVMVPHASHFIDHVLKKDPRTQDLEWEVGVGCEVGELGVIDIPSLSTATTEYDIVALASTGAAAEPILLFGERGYSPPMSKEERHSRLDGQGFKRASEADWQNFLAASIRYQDSALKRTWAIIGAGAVGRSLARELRKYGHTVVFGSRKGDAAEVEGVPSTSHAQALKEASVVVLTVPWDAVEPLLGSIGPLLAGKVVIDATNPIAPGFKKAPTGAHASGGELVQSLCPGAAAVLKCFNTIGQTQYGHPYSFPASLAGTAIRRDMWLAGTPGPAKTWLSHVLRQQLGFRPLDSGDMEAANLLEAVCLLWCRNAYAYGKGQNIAIKLL